MRTTLSSRQSANSGSDKVLLSATSAALLTLIPVAAHQLGYLRHLVDPPAKIFASDEITESATAHPFGIPDSLLGLGSYGLTLTLIVLARSRPRVRKLLTFKLIGDGAVASFNVVHQVVKFGKICSWCTGTALCTAAMMLSGGRLIAEQTRDRTQEL